MQINNTQEFPALKRTANTLNQPNYWQKTREAPKIHNQQYSTTAIKEYHNEKNNESGMNELLTITDTIKEINELCDMKKMLELVIQLKNNLRSCKSNTEKFQTILEFTDKLDEP